jgi:hypothetical protein
MILGAGLIGRGFVNRICVIPKGMCFGGPLPQRPQHDIEIVHPPGVRADRFLDALDTLLCIFLLALKLARQAAHAVAEAVDDAQDAREQESAGCDVGRDTPTSLLRWQETKIGLLELLVANPSEIGTTVN